MSLLSGVDHAENFPVASVLCPRPWRAAVIAIYRFARTADDWADEGDWPAAHRLRMLAGLRATLQACWAGADWHTLAAPAWAPWLAALDAARRRHALPLAPLLALLDAFEQDVRWQASGRRYRDEAELLAYCQRSANPVGRLLLHLCGVRDPVALMESDAICTALQLINLWQDLGRDNARGRCYVTDAARQRHGLPPEADLAAVPDDRLTPLVQEGCQLARAHLRRGWALPQRLPGRFGWELRLVLQGGLCVLQRVERLGGRVRQRRPALRALDWPWLLARTLAHRPPACASAPGMEGAA